MGAVLRTGLALPIATSLQKAEAFDNRLPPDEFMKKYKVPKSPGPKPDDIGLQRGSELKACNDGKPHCLSSSPEFFEDGDLYAPGATGETSPAWLVEPFKY